MNPKSELFTKICSVINNQFSIDKLSEQQYQLIYDCIDQYIIKSKSSNKKLSESITFYLNAKKAEGLSLITINNYKLSLKLLNNYLNNPPITEIDADKIREFLIYLKENRHLKKSSIQTNLCAIRTFFSWLHNEHYIDENPLNRIKSTHIDKKNTRHPLQSENVEKARNACISKRDKAIFEFFLSTGCRLSEVINIKTENINFYNRSVTVTGKGDKVVYFSVRAKIFIEDYLNNESKNKTYLFTSSVYPYNKLTNRGMERIIHKIGEKANLKEPLYPHKLRHTFATNALSSGMDITSIQQLLGHNDLNTTQIYAEINNSIVHSQYNRMIN